MLNQVKKTVYRDTLRPWDLVLDAREINAANCVSLTGR
jgi:hypothetical protein